MSLRKIILNEFRVKPFSFKAKPNVKIPRGKKPKGRNSRNSQRGYSVRALIGACIINK